MGNVQLLVKQENIERANEILNKSETASQCNDDNEEDENPDTALIYAVKNDVLEIAETLLTLRGANPNAKDSTGKSALDYAKAAGNQKMISLLRKHGAV